MSRERIEALREKFAAFDNNGDSYLSFEEMRDLLHRGDPGMSDGDLHRLFNHLDKSGDGLIDFDEFIDYVFAKTGEHRELEPWRVAALHDAFVMCDKDRTGMIAASELPDLLFYAELDSALSSYVLDKYDVDSAGGLNFDQVLQFMLDVRAYADRVVAKMRPRFAEQEVWPLGDLQDILETEEEELNIPTNMLQGMLTRYVDDDVREVCLDELIRAFRGEPNRDVKALREMSVCQVGLIEVEDPDEGMHAILEDDYAKPSGKSAQEVVKEFEAEFGIEFSWRGCNDSGGTIKGETISESDVFKVLDKEGKENIYYFICKLPKFEKKILRKITVAKNLRSTHWGPVGGLGGQDQVWLNGDSLWSMHHFCGTLVHELTHMIDHNDNAVNDPADKKYRKMNPPGFRYNNEKGGYGDLLAYKLDVGTGAPGFITSYSQAAVCEDKAVALQKWMFEREKVQGLFEKPGGDVVQHKLKTLFSDLINFNNGFDDVFWKGNLQVGKGPAGASAGGAGAAAAEEPKSEAPGFFDSKPGMFYKIGVTRANARELCKRYPDKIEGYSYTAEPPGKEDYVYVVCRRSPPIAHTFQEGYKRVIFVNPMPPGRTPGSVVPPSERCQPCRYGMGCNNTDDDHRKNFHHPERVSYPTDPLHRGLRHPTSDCRFHPGCKMGPTGCDFTHKPMKVCPNASECTDEDAEHRSTFFHATASTPDDPYHKGLRYPEKQCRFHPGCKFGITCKFSHGEAPGA